MYWCLGYFAFCFLFSYVWAGIHVQVCAQVHLCAEVRQPGELFFSWGAVHPLCLSVCLCVCRQVLSLAWTMWRCRVRRSYNPKYLFVSALPALGFQAQVTILNFLIHGVLELKSCAGAQDTRVLPTGLPLAASSVDPLLWLFLVISHVLLVSVTAVWFYFSSVFSHSPLTISLP